MRRSSPLLDDLGQLVVDDLPLPLGVEDRLQVGDARLDLGQLVEDPLALQGGQPTQLHVQDRGRLDLVDVEELHQPAAGVVGRLAVADEGDDLVEVVEGLGVAAQDVRALLGLAQPVPRAPLDDLDLVVHVELDQLVEAQRPRDAVDDREHVAPNVVCSWVCLLRLFSTTLATASRRSVMTSRRPTRSLDSSAISLIPCSRPSLTASAIASARLSGLTW